MPHTSWSVLYLSSQHAVLLEDLDSTSLCIFQLHPKITHCDKYFSRDASYKWELRPSARPLQGQWRGRRIRTEQGEGFFTPAGVKGLSEAFPSQILGNTNGRSSDLGRNRRKKPSKQLQKHWRKAYNLNWRSWRKKTGLLDGEENATPVEGAGDCLPPLLPHGWSSSAELGALLYSSYHKVSEKHSCIRSIPY